MPIDDRLRDKTIATTPVGNVAPRLTDGLISNTPDPIMPSGSGPGRPDFVTAVFAQQGVTQGSGGGGTPTIPPVGLLSISQSAGTVGVPFSATISGATAGSNIVLDTMTVSGTGTTRTVTGTPTTAGTWSAVETLAGAPNSPRTTPNLVTIAAAGAINLSGAQARVAITDASYFIGNTASTDTAYVSNLKASSTNKTVPFPSNQTIPFGSIGYVILRIPATDANSPPIYINWDGAQGQPSTASPFLPTVLVATDANTALPPSPTNGTFVQDNSFVPFRPSTATDLAYGGRGQRYFIDTVAPARDIMVKFDLTNAAITQNVTPVVCCSSGQWIWEVGMSIIRNQFTTISTVAANRAAVISAVPGSDPFFFVSARSGANQQAIIDEQVTPVTNSSTLLKFIRGIRENVTINDLAFANVRPLSAQTQAVRDGVGSRYTQILSTLKGLGRVLVAADTTYGNYSTATPAVNGDLQSANGNFPWVLNVLGPIHKAQVPSAFDPAYDWPFVMQSAAMANTYETAMADEVHPNGTGYTPQFKTTETPNLKLLYGAAPGPNTMQSIVTSLGSSTTIALKTRAQAVFDMVNNQYPTATGSTAATNRTTLRAQLDAITAT